MSATRKPGLFCGAAVDLPKRTRALMFALFALVSASLCYSQFGIMAWGNDLTGDLNFVLFLVPVALCTVMLGAVPGVGLAVLTGFLIMFRAWWTPTTLYDSQMADPFLSVVSITAGAVLMAVFVTFGARRWPADLGAGVKTFKRVGPARLFTLFTGCFMLSFAFSYGTRGLMYLVVTPGGAEYNYASMIAGYLASLSGPLVFLEGTLNGIILAAACIVSVVYDANRRSGTWKSGLNASFNRWLGLAMLVVFLVASSVSFCAETMRATDEANAQIMAELEYVRQQVEAREQEGGSAESVIEGYRTALGGEVVVVRDHTIVASNVPEYVGEPASKMLSSGELDNYEFLAGLAAESMLTGSDEDTGEFLGVRALVSGDYTYLMAAPLSAMYQARTSTLISNAAFLLAMLVAVFLVVRLLLHRIVVSPIHHTNDSLAAITAGDLDRRVEEREVIEFDELSSGINTTVAALGDMIAEVEQRNAQDLVTAKAIQESALPRTFPAFPHINRFDIYASMTPAREVGGDFYDFFLVGGSKLAFLIADVSGKGIPAALFMMAAKTQIKNRLESGMPIGDAIEIANDELCDGNDAGMFVTVFACVLDYETGKLDYVNAGHNPPLVRHDGQWTWLNAVSGMPLGLFGGIPYDRFELELVSGDALYLYTDGVSEALSMDKTFFGEERLFEVLGRCANQDAQLICADVRDAVSNFTRGAEQSDDITMLALVM